jgi:hypothetical protein
MGNTKRRTDQFTFRGQGRSFVQEEGPGPNNPLKYFSDNGGLGAFEQPLGEPEARLRVSDTVRGGYDIVGEVMGKPELGSLPLQDAMPRAVASRLEQLAESGYPFAAQYIIDKRASSQAQDTWESKVIFEGIRLTNLKSEDLENIEAEDGEVFFSADAKFSAWGRVRKLQFSLQHSPTVKTVALAIGDPNLDYPVPDPSKKGMWGVTLHDGTNAASFVYSVDGGLTRTTVALTSVFGTNDPTDLAEMGDYIILLCQASEAYAYAHKSNLSAWTKVSGGFVASKGPNRIWVKNGGEAYIVGQGGYLYKLTTPGQPVTVLNAGILTAQNLTSIHGRSGFIVAVGAANTVVISTNGGISWSAITGPIVSTILNTVAVLNESTLMIGAANGNLYYSKNRGSVWATSVFEGAGSGSVETIVFDNELQSVGYMAHTTGAPAGRVFRTTNGGTSWELQSMSNLPANVQVTALATKGPNLVLAGGLVSAGGAGFIAAAR